MKTLQEIENNLFEVYQDLKELRGSQEQPKGISNVTVDRLPDGTVTMSWSGISSEEIDVQFQVNGNKKWHSVRWMIEDDKDADDNDYNPPALPEQNEDHNEYEFHVPSEKAVEVRLVEGGYNQGTKTFEIENVIVSEPFSKKVEDESMEDYFNQVKQIGR